VLLCIFRFVLSGSFPRNVRVLNAAKVCATIGFDNNEIAVSDREASAFMYIEDVRSAAFEVDNIKWCRVGTVE